ncbi:Arc family DNA-binding protein [Blautia coccoides]|uniref:Arc family DNA-binding protein n=1 Tax=Lachnospiraceae TaxID=186803 RepID=UPI001961C379|nr:MULTISPECIES: Arc family DNA-binding protein [Lachnospiraceae]MBM6750028.1 Arc family DNA-binding protein [Mediterraneibacter glycyrrhizinilyticus]MDT4375174.1 Arc family DNA-binding protein [Blautia coccoides]
MRKNKSEEKHIGLRIDSETHGKLKNLAAYEGRSINGELLYLIRQAIAAHEKENNCML